MVSPTSPVRLKVRLGWVGLGVEPMVDIYLPNGSQREGKVSKVGGDEDSYGIGYLTGLKNAK